VKTLIKNGVSLYVFEDNEYVKMEDSFIQVGYPPKFFISDCNISNTTLFENVTPPSDWFGCKYLFNGTDWSVDPNYVEFVPPVAPTLPVPE
jgi:hypothetical protein